MIKKIPVPLLIVSLFCLFSSCQKEVTGSLDQPLNEVLQVENQKLGAAVTRSTTTTYLNGYVIDENKAPLTNASVSCGGKSTFTDNKGYFQFKQVLTVNKDYVLITVKKAGYMNGFRTFTPNRTRLAYHTEKIMLLTESAAQTLPAAGGTITIDNIKLTFPANAVTKPNNAAYPGNYKITARYINPQSAGFELQVPGMLAGLNSAGTIRALQSYGMATVEIRDEAGNKLQIAAGKSVKMELPAPAGSPATIPLWHFNETYGLWIQAGEAIKTGNVFVAEVNHFSVWNIDLEFNSFELNLKFQTVNAVPLVNLQVEIYRPNNVFFNTFFTDDHGEATLINCSSNESLTLKMIYDCDTIFRTLAPVTQTRSETITLTGSNIQDYSLSGTLYTCNNVVLKNQPFQVFLTGNGRFVTLNGISDPSGAFSFSTIFPICQNTGNLIAQSSAYFNNQFYFSGFKPVIQGPNVYNPVLCDSIVNGQTFNDSDVVTFADINLEQKVRLTINRPTGTLYYLHVKNVDTLYAGSININSLLGIQYLTGLEYANLWANNISDITPLQNLVNLGELDLSTNPISNISPLQNLVRMQRLWLNYNQVNDISVLQNFSLLQYLEMKSNQVSNISALQNLTLLQYLYLDGNQISNITPLQNLVNLRGLSLHDNQITNITALQNMTQLSGLYLNNNQITNLAPLQNLLELRDLKLEGNQITNVTPLQNLPVLNDLYLWYNQITTIQPIVSSLPNLFLLRISVGNTVPGSEITAFQTNHPGSVVQ